MVPGSTVRPSPLRPPPRSSAGGRRPGPWLGLGVLLALGGCGDALAFVELNWQFVDKQQRKIYPGGRESDVCGLTGTGSEGPEPYDLRVRLTISTASCPGGPADPECQVIPPTTFSCRRARASLTEVPADEDEPYLITAEVLVDPIGERAAFVPRPTCAAVPGPRERRVLPGGTVDLQVYQFVMNGIDPSQPTRSTRRLDLDACAPPEAAPDG